MRRVTGRPLLGYLQAVGAAMCYGGAQVIARYVVQSASPVVTSTFALLFGLVAMALMWGRHLDTARRAPRAEVAWMALSGLTASGGMFSMYMALQRVPVAVAAPIAGIYPLVAVFMAWAFLGALERVTWRTFLGVALVVGGIALVLLNGF